MSEDVEEAHEVSVVFDDKVDCSVTGDHERDALPCVEHQI